MTSTLTPSLRPGSCLIEALLALDPDSTPLDVASNFTPAPATLPAGADWPPDQWD